MKVNVFGLGKDYEEYKKDLSGDGYSIIGLYDNDLRKIGKKFDGMVVSSGKELCKGDKVLVMSSVYKYEIVNQLLAQGVCEKDIILREEAWVKKYFQGSLIVSDGRIRLVSEDFSTYILDKLQEEIFRDIFCSESYNYNSCDPCVVIDVGLNAGFASMYFGRKSNVVKIYGFELDLDLFAQAEKNIRLNDSVYKKIEIFPIALGKENKTEQYVSVNKNKSGGIRKIRESDGYDEIEKGITVKCVDVAEKIAPIINNHSNEKIVLKIDCEGAEYEIFERMESASIIEDIDVIVMEWHLGKRMELEEYLKKHRFGYFIKNTTDKYGLCYAFR